MTEFEADELRRDRDAWRDLALAQAELMKMVTQTVIECNHTIRIDGRTLGEALRTTQLVYSRRNALRLS